MNRLKKKPDRNLLPSPDLPTCETHMVHLENVPVPQMPVGTPGMEMGDRKDPFTVFSFDRQGRFEFFNRYPSS